MTGIGGGTVATDLTVRTGAAAVTERRSVRVGLTVLAVGFLGLVLLVPLAAVGVEAFRKGVAVYLAALGTDETRSALRVTLIAAVIAVPLNAGFGFTAAWVIAKFRFPGRALLLTAIDLPFAVSPVIAGMIFVLVFGAQGWLGPWLDGHGIRIIFALPGIVLATTFVTFPFVARELIPLMEEQGREEEEAAVALGASGWQVVRRVTLPNVRWGVVYGVVLCTARAVGEFGAVSVVSGHVRGATNTLPLHVEILYDEYDFVGAFAVASVLTLLAAFTLVAKQLVERRMRTRTRPVPTTSESP